MNVTAKLIDTLVKNKRFYVNDYLFLPNSDLLLITSKINIRGFELCYYKKERGITETRRIRSETGESIVTDCFKNIHLLTSDFSRQLFFDSDSTFDFLPKYARSKFDSTLGPCALKLDTQIVFKYSPPKMLIRNKFWQNTLFLNYLAVSKHSKNLLYTVMYNKEMRKMLDFEMRDGDMIIANFEAFGLGAPIAALNAGHQLFYTRVATPIYAPIFLKNDTIVIFNFQENTIVSVNGNNDEFINEIKLDEKTFSTLHEFEVIQDVPKQQFYLKTIKGDRPILQAINIYNGDLSTEIKLEKVFAKNIQVHNGKIYYLVKEKGWDDTCYLYQQNW